MHACGQFNNPHNLKPDWQGLYAVMVDMDGMEQAKNKQTRLNRIFIIMLN